MKSASQYIPGLFSQSRVLGFWGLEMALATWQAWQLLTKSSVSGFYFLFLLLNVSASPASDESPCGKCGGFSAGFEDPIAWAV